MNHGVYVTEQETRVTTTLVAETGIPFVVGTAPTQAAANPAKAGVPVLCTSWAEAVEKLGYSEDWSTYTLCEFMYSHFHIYGAQPAVFVNVLDIGKMTESVPAEDKDVTDHKVALPISAVAGTVEVKPEGGDSEALVLDTDYITVYDGEQLVVELLPASSSYGAEKLNIGYSKVTTDSVTKTEIANGFEAVSLCLSKVGKVPDLLLAPGFSSDPEVAAVMAAKAAGIHGMCKAKALIDIDCSEEGAKSGTEAVEKKKSSGMTDKEQIVCWPMVSLGGKLYHLSTHLAGVIATLDADNGGVPYESPDNKTIRCDGLVLADMTEINQSLDEANDLNANGIVTALNFVNGWTAWGSYTACYPASTDVKDYFIPISRMFGWVSNTLVSTYWARIGKPMSRLVLDSIVDSANIWLNGLTSGGYLYGARVEMNAADNPDTDLMNGIVKFHVYITPPAPAQEIDFTLEYDASYVQAALAS